ncbi:hypothetical protein AKO1_011232 [Acrasis kona]|uniref:Uncharacterized protein n=1 Tax=Acrasis kona TaxID=1008807 RepID=A0AAW2YXF7_9EUKA
MGYDSDEDEDSDSLYATEEVSKSYGADALKSISTSKTEGAVYSAGLESIMTPDEIIEWSAYRDSSYKGIEAEPINRNTTEKSPQSSPQKPNNNNTDQDNKEAPIAEQVESHVQISSEVVESKNAEVEKPKSVKFEEVIQTTTASMDGMDDDEEDPLGMIMQNSTTEDEDFEIEYQ